MKNLFRILIAFLAIPILLASCQATPKEMDETSAITTGTTATEEAPTATTGSTSTESNPGTPSVEPPAEIRVATFNVQSSLSTTEKGDLTAASQVRLDSLIKEILSYDLDVISLQEDAEKINELLSAELVSAGYACYADPVPGSGEDQRCGIYYRAERFELLESGVKDLPHGTFKGTIGTHKNLNSSHHFFLRYVILRDKETGKSFLSANTHLISRNQNTLGIFQTATRIQARIHQIVGYEEMIDALRVGEYVGIPVCVTGDMNTVASASFEFHDTLENAKAFGVPELTVGATGVLKVPYHCLDNDTNSAVELPYEITKVTGTDVYFKIQSPTYSRLTANLKDSFVVAKKTNATDTNYGSWNSYLGSKAGKNKSTERLDYILTDNGFTVEEYQIGDGYATYLRDNNGVDELKLFEEDLLAALSGTLTSANAKFAYDFVKNGSSYTATKLPDWLTDNGGIYAYCYTNDTGEVNTVPRTFFNYLSYCAYYTLTPGKNVKGTADRIEVCTSDHLCSIAVLSFAE